MTKATYYFYTGRNRPDLESIGHHDAVSAFLAIKKLDQENYFKIKKYNKLRELPSQGYSLLDIGYGLSVAYRRVPDREK